MMGTPKLSQEREAPLGEKQYAEGDLEAARQ